jgi:hypothetical protein
MASHANRCAGEHDSAPFGAEKFTTVLLWMARQGSGHPGDRAGAPDGAGGGDEPMNASCDDEVMIFPLTELRCVPGVPRALYIDVA